MNKHCRSFNNISTPGVYVLLIIYMNNSSRIKAHVKHVQHIYELLFVPAIYRNMYDQHTGQLYEIHQPVLQTLSFVWVFFLFMEPFALHNSSQA